MTDNITPAQASREGLLAMWAAIDAREIAKSKAPPTIDMSKQRMRMSGGQYAVGQGINAPVDPVSGVPIAGA